MRGADVIDGENLKVMAARVGKGLIMQHLRVRIQNTCSFHAHVIPLCSDSRLDAPSAIFLSYSNESTRKENVGIYCSIHWNTR
jgi:hypothetical protein